MPNDLWTPERLSAVRILAAEGVGVKIHGGCMLPLLQHGTRVQVRPARRYWPGDVLVVRSQTQGLIAHRLIGGYRKGGRWRWLTQADNGQRPDAAVSRQDILGRIVGGDCAPEIASVPLMHRVRAASRFLGFVLTRLAAR